MLAGDARQLKQTSDVRRIARMAAQRPLRFGLRSRDILFFMHIPRNAGTTLFAQLETRFAENETLSLGGPNLHEFLAKSTSSQFEDCRLIRGHLDYSIYKYLPRKPVYVTMLRDPIQRVVSLYGYVRDNPEHRFHRELINSNLTLGQFIQRPEPRKIVSNEQVRMLVGLRRREAAHLSNRAMLEMAMMRLDEFAFFGLVEHFIESLKLLQFTFDWPPFEDIGALNKARTNSGSPKYEQSDLDDIRDSNELDMALYSYAKQLFAARLNVMRETIGKQPRSNPYTEQIEVIVGRKSVRTRLMGSVAVRALGKIRRQIIPEGSAYEEAYLRIRRRMTGW